MAYPQIRRVLPLPQTAPQFSMQANRPAASRPVGGISSTTTQDGGQQQGGGSSPLGGAIQMMALRKMIGGTATPAATLADGASAGAGPTGIGASLGLDGAGNTTALGEAMTSAGPAGQYAPMGGITGMGTSPAAGAVEMAPLGPSGMIGGAGSTAAADTAAFTGVGADAAVGGIGGTLPVAGEAATVAAVAPEAMAAPAIAEGGALAAAAPEAGLLAGMGPMGWAALGGLGLFGAGKAFDWW